jgi:regulator of replication initiation timing
MKPKKPLSPMEIKSYIENLHERNVELQQENEDLRKDLTDAQADAQAAKADAAQLKAERVAFKTDPDVIALKAHNQTSFMAQSATDRDIAFFKFCKAL